MDIFGALGGDDSKQGGDGDGGANLWVAASDGNEARVMELLASGMSVNAQDEYGYSPLHAVVGYGHVALMRRLLAAGADVNLQDTDGDTPLHACEHVACAKLLLEAGADLAAVNSSGQTVRGGVPGRVPCGPCEPLVASCKVPCCAPLWLPPLPCAAQSRRRAHRHTPAFPVPPHTLPTHPTTLAAAA